MSELLRGLALVLAISGLSSCRAWRAELPVEQDGWRLIGFHTAHFPDDEQISIQVSTEGTRSTCLDGIGRAVASARGTVYALTVSADGRSVAWAQGSGDATRGAYVARIDNALLRTRYVGDELVPVAWSRDGTRLALVHGEGSGLVVCDVDAGTRTEYSVAIEDGLEDPPAAWFSPNGEELVFTDSGGEARILRLVDGCVSSAWRREESDAVPAAIGGWLLDGRIVLFRAESHAILFVAPRGAVVERTTLPGDLRLEAIRPDGGVALATPASRPEWHKYVDPLKMRTPYEVVDLVTGDTDLLMLDWKTRWMRFLWVPAPGLPAGRID